MNRVQLAAALLLLAFAAKGQESSPRQTSALKIYNLTDWQRYSYSESQKEDVFLRTTESNLRIFHPTFAYRREQRKGRYHEFELTELHFFAREESAQPVTAQTGAPGAVQEGEQVIRLAFSVRYEYQMSIGYDEEKSWDFSVGLGINPYYFFQDVMPSVTTDFPERLHITGARLFAVPRFIWNLSPRMFLDVNLPICLSEFRHRYHYDESPTIPVGERGTAVTEFSTLPALFSGRIGLGFKL